MIFAHFSLQVLLFFFSFLGALLYYGMLYYNELQVFFSPRLLFYSVFALSCPVLGMFLIFIYLLCSWICHFSFNGSQIGIMPKISLAPHLQKNLDVYVSLFTFSH